MPGEIPSAVQAIRPDITTVPLAFYTANGELFSTQSATEQFVIDSWNLWRDLSRRQIARFPYTPQVVVLDFGQVTRLTVDRADVGLATTVGFFGVRNEVPCYVVFDQVISTNEEDSPWESLGTMFKALRRKRSGIGRREGASQYELIGDLHYSKTFDGLLAGGSWVNSSDFPKSGEKLKMMSERDLLLRTTRGTHRYYHTPVGFD